MKRDIAFLWKYHKEEFTNLLNAVTRRIIKKNIFEKGYGKKVMAPAEGNEWLYQKISAGQPFVAARFGSIEIETFWAAEYEKKGGKLGGLTKRKIRRITMQAGFFPAEKPQVFKFQTLYKDLCCHVDGLGIWNIFMQTEMISEYMPHTLLFELRALEPYYHETPWTRALEGKKVLVIHPFAETIQRQFQKREHLFENPQILPEFELKTLKAVQTLAGETDDRFADWFEALEYMYQEALKLDFDVALIGCGAYGLPLAVKLKEAGKMAVHIGGALQLLFGIKGKRWDEHEVISKMYNEYWVRPDEKDRMQQAGKVEGGCYW